MGSMWPFSFFMCIGPLVMLGLIAVSIRTLWITLVPPRNMPREAACGRCGYAVAGLHQPTCPECGADWRGAGITTPALIMRYRGGIFGAIVAWTILLGAAGLLILGLGAALVGRQYVSVAASAPTTWTTPLSPASGAYTGVDFVSSGMMGRGAQDITLDLTLSGGAVWKMAIDPSTKNCEITDPAQPGATTVLKRAPGSIAAFYKAAGLDTTNTKIAAEAAELEKIVDLQVMSPYTQPSQMNLTTFTPGALRFSGAPSVQAASGPAAWVGIAMVLGGIVWLVIYTAGIVYIVVRRGRILGKYAEQAVYSPGM